MSEEKGTNCSCGLAKGASLHVKGSGSFDHEPDIARKKPRRPQPMGRSEVGVAIAEQWAEEKADHLVLHPECEVAGFLPGRCWNKPGEGPDVHHVTPRGMGGTRYDDGAIVTLCRRHHDYIESRRQYAKVIGLLESRQLPVELRSLAEIPE